MSAIVTNKMRLNNAKSVISNITNERDFYYFFIAKPTTWTNENSPDPSIDNADLQNSLFDELIALKKVSVADVKIGAKRYNWTSGTYYQYFDDTIDIYDYNDSSFAPFYVITNDLNVYKCLWNGAIRESAVPISLTIDGSSGSVVSAGSDTITSNNHGLTDGVKVHYSAGAGTAIQGLTSATSYFVRDATTHTFKLSLTSGGGAIDLTGTGTGTAHTILQESFPLSQFTYTQGVRELVVYVNGVRQATTVYTETNTASVTFVTGVVSGTDNIVFEKRAPSTVKPTSTATDGTEVISTLADGYRWKFMFAMTAANATKFLASNWIPVETLVADDTTSQWDVQTNAVTGLCQIKVETNGSGYAARAITGTTGAGSTSTSIVFAAGTPGNNDDYNGMSVYIVSGTGAGQVRVISDYVASTLTATVSAWTVTPDTTSVYEVCPTIEITSNTGTGAVAYVPYASLGAAGEILGVRMASVGSGYKDAVVTVSGTPAVGSGATFSAVISPEFGHGNDSQRELGAVAVITNMELDGTESGAIVADNDFRKTGLIRNPITETGVCQAANATTITLASSASNQNDTYNSRLIQILNKTGKGQIKKITDYVGSTQVATIEYARPEADAIWATTPVGAESVYGIIANGSIYSMATRLTYTGSISGSFSQDEIITQATSNATGTVLYVDTTNKYVYVVNTTKSFQVGQIISGSSGSVNVTAVTTPSILKGYGDVVITENRRKVTRSSDQKEKFLIILES